MRNFRMLPFLFIVLSILILSSSVALAQDQENEEEEEGDTLRNLKRAVALFLTQNTNDDLSYINDTRKLLELGPMSVEFQSLPLGSRVLLEAPQIPVFKIFGISTVLPNPYIGSPAYEIVNTWRNSLNIDVVTGKYYWEW